MGYAIVYCSACGIRLMSPDVINGRAVPLPLRIRCASCIRKEIEAELVRPPGPETRRRLRAV